MSNALKKGYADPKHWTYGAERAKGREVMFTMGMRGDGDEPLSGASVGLVESEYHACHVGTSAKRRHYCGTAGYLRPGLW